MVGLHDATGRPIQAHIVPSLFFTFFRVYVSVSHVQDN